MNTYAVAYLSYFDNILQMTQVEADNPVAALIEGVREITDAKEDDAFLNPFYDLLPGDLADALEEIRTAFFDADTAVEVIPILT